MAVDSVLTQSSTGVDGNSYTTAISNDKLTNEDFMKLMIEELKMQDPTKPMDTQAMMDSQLKMSTMQANLDMTEAMTQLQTSYFNSALSTAANLIGKIVEDGTLDSDGLMSSYKVDTVENIDGELFLNAKQLTGVADGLVNAETEKIAPYDSDGYIYDGETKTDYRLAFDQDGRFTYNEDGTIKILDDNGNVVTDQDILDKYKYGGSSFIYSDQVSKIAIGNVVQVR